MRNPTPYITFVAVCYGVLRRRERKPAVPGGTPLGGQGRRQRQGVAVELRARSCTSGLPVELLMTDALTQKTVLISLFVFLALTPSM